MNTSLNSIYVATGDIDGAVECLLVTTYDEAAEIHGGSGHSTVRCEVCQRIVCSTFRDGVVEGATFKPHTFEPMMTGIALCLPCQMGQVASGDAIIMSEDTATAMFAESTGRHAAA